MTTQERLQKSLEALKTLTQNIHPDQTRKKEKIYHCYVVSEAFSNPTIKVSTNFPVLLGVTVETFLKLCDDTDADVRMTSDECLNRIIRAVSDGHIGKIQIELHKEIKKNGSSRSLRAALLRFSYLAHYIRPHKGRPYVANLFPSIVRIADRTEEAVHETLASCLPKILKSLGTFATDNDIKGLLKAFLQNVTKPSAAIRRTTSSCILSICTHSRKPYYFVAYCINYLLDILIPVDVNQSSFAILGVLHCLKVLIPSLKDNRITNEGTSYSKDTEIIQSVSTSKLFQIYELCVYYLTHCDHNIINAALDTLNIFLLNASNEIEEKLLNPNGLDKCRIHGSMSVNNIRSPSQLSVVTTVAPIEENIFEESELTETTESVVEKWIAESKLSVLNISNVKKVEETNLSDKFGSQFESNATIQYYDISQRLSGSCRINTEGSSIVDTLDNFSEKSSEESVTSSGGKELDRDYLFHEIDIGDYLDRCVPLLYCARLITKSFLLSGIPNKYISDKTVRISVKSSAFICLSSIFRLYPYGFYAYLDKNYSASAVENSKLSDQKISDIMILGDHPDPHLRGIARFVASDVVTTILKRTNLDFSLWKKYLLDHMMHTGIQMNITSPCGVKEFVDIWIKGLKDANSNCLRQTLLSLKSTLNIISESTDCCDVLPILKVIVVLTANPYWLVKVALCELVSQISYITLHNITGDSLFQRKVLHNILFEFLKDPDQRIRSAASTAIIDIMEHLYFEDYHPKESTVTNKGIYLVRKYMLTFCDNKMEENLYWSHFVENMPFPYSQIQVTSCERRNYLLAKIIIHLYTDILRTNSKYSICGCIETLSALSNKYPCTVYPLAWGISSKEKNSAADSGCDNVKDLLGLCISLLNSSMHVYDIPLMVNLMNLTSNLFAGYSMIFLKPVDVTEKTPMMWSMFSNESVRSLSDQYLVHIMKLLNIFHLVINDMLPASPQAKAVLPHLPSTASLSPIKKRRSDDRKLTLAATSFSTEKDDKNEKNDGKVSGIGYFVTSQHYMRVFELLRSASVNYKISLDPVSSESFIELMRNTIHSLCVIMEVGTLYEFGSIAEEILTYLNSAFPLDHSLTVQCVQQLLKCLFGTNLAASLGDMMSESVDNEGKNEDCSFYHNVLQKPYEEISLYINSLSTVSKVECDGDNTIMGYLHRKDIKKPAAVSRTSDKTLANYIRIFEPMVINSLKQYTVTSDIVFQCCVLKLLSQLLQLRVNYCLLDSEQVFKDFVLKQFEYIEEGLMQFPERIIPRIFQFLVHLSYSKQHSRSIIDIPKVIQLCDGLMASGQDPKTHCIPALEPIVEDVFLVRSRSNTTDMKELETTREVVLSMLLRLLEYREVIDLITLILEDSKYCTDDSEKWLRWSAQVASVFLHMLRHNKIKINGMNTFASLRKFIFDKPTYCFHQALNCSISDLSSNTTDMKELETTREVVLSMLLRLLEYREVIDLITLILEDSKYCTDDSEKWLRWSAQVANVFLHMLRHNKIKINEMNTFASLRKFIFALNPNVFRPANDVIVMLFQEPPSVLDECLLIRWLCRMILLFFIISPLKEEVLIEKINLLKGEFSPGSVFENFSITADPLNVYNNANIFHGISGDVLIARLILRVISVVSAKITKDGLNCNEILANLFSIFLMYCSHIFQSGSLCKVSQAAELLTKSTSADVNMDVICRNFSQIKITHPIITCQWSHILSIINYNILEFWKSILNSDNHSINNRLVKTGGTIVFCDYLNENITETKQLSWILSEQSKVLVDLVEEIPVSEFISFVHRDVTLSKMFVNGIFQSCLAYSEPVFRTKILKCVENCHTSQTGTVVKLLIPGMLCNWRISVSRMVAHLASRKLELLFTMPKDEILKQLSKEDLSVIKEELSSKGLTKKNETLISLLNKLLVRYYDISPLEFGVTRLVNPEYIRKLVINKKWFLSQIQGKYQDSMLREETAKVMERLEYKELASFMSSGDFNKLILRDCIERGVQILRDEGLGTEPPILKAAIDNILKEVSRIMIELRGSFEMFSNEIDKKTDTVHLLSQFDDEQFTLLIQNLCYSLSTLMKHISHLPTLQLSEIDCENISKFAVIALEYSYFISSVHKNNSLINYLEVLLDCSNEILKLSQFCNYLGLDVNISWLCFAINALYNLVQSLLINTDPLPSVELDFLEISEDLNVKQAQKSCYNLYSLTCWLYNIQNKHAEIPNFLFRRIKGLIISLSRLPLVNSYNLVPCRVWKVGWQPDLTGKFLTQVTPLPIDLLQDIEILEEYIFRVTLLGWTTRQQFEETWMCFLSVLCSPVDSSESSDINIVRRASSMAVRAITAQLLQTLRYPVLGDRNVSSIIHVSRNRPIPDASVSTKKLKIVQDHMERKYNELCNNNITEEILNVFSNRNFEKISDNYSYGQLSIRYFLASINEKDNPGTYVETMYQKRMTLLNEDGLDVNSCLQFLLDYFTQIMKSESVVTDIRVLHEVIRSTLYISDLFTDKVQFSWMLDIFLELSKDHAVEDELIHQYLVVGICKAVGILQPDLEVFEQVKKLMTQALRSPFLPTRISCLYGLLYILEGCLLNNIAIGGVSEELQLILPQAVEYVQMHLNTDDLILNQSQEHTLLVWSLAFYLVENVDEVHMESNFVVTTLQTAVSRVQRKPITSVNKRIIKGLERVLLVKPLYVLEKIGKSLQTLALEKMKDENPSVSILAVQLLATYMYADCWEHLEKPDPDSEQSSPDHLVQTIEKISAIFERIKKGYMMEVEVLCSVLPIILRDFFSPSDILTKVIGEFLSPQQPHPQLMSGVVFQVFDSAIQLNQLSLLQDWVVFSLSNFTQSFSNMATWCLTCFFISASTNEWLKSFFPYVQNRVGRYEYEDKKIFCIAGSDFYKNLISDNQRKTFIDSFMIVKDHRDTPFCDLLNSL